MNPDLLKAKKALTDQALTCVLVKGEEILTSGERGVKPLLTWLEEERDLQGFSAADKVVGKGAAMLYVLLKVKELYATVISQGAYETLMKFQIPVTYEKLVERIRNRAGDGFCPIEESVLAIEKPEEALPAIRKRLKLMKKIEN